MIKRGRILRGTDGGEGLISCEGKQYPFRLETNWECDLHPATGMVVDFEVDEEGKLVAAWAIDEKELAKEQAQLLLNESRQKAASIYRDLESALGKSVLLATAALILGWFMLNTLVINVNFGFGFQQTNTLSFWQLLGVVNNANNFQGLMGGGLAQGSKGIYGALCVAAILGPFLFLVWKHPLAHLGNCLALILVLIVVGSAYFTITEHLETGKQALESLGGPQAQSMAADFAQKALDRVLQMVHIGWGTYVWVVASIYLAFVGITNFLVAQASTGLDTLPSQSAGRLTGRRPSAAREPK